MGRPSRLNSRGLGSYVSAEPLGCKDIWPNNNSLRPLDVVPIEVVDR